MTHNTILFVYTGPFYPISGGIERVTDTLAKIFIQTGYRVLYLVLDGEDLASEYNYPAPLFFFPSNDSNHPENIPFYHRFLKEQNIDIIINQSGSFPESKLFLNVGDNNVKIISVLHCNPAMGYKYLHEEYKSFLLSKKFTNKLIYLFGVLPFFTLLQRRVYFKKRKHYRLLSQKSDYICLLSNKFEDELYSLYPVPKEKVIAISNPNSFSPFSLPEKKKKQLLYVGRLVMLQKRPDRLLMIWEKIYREFPDWELKFVGDGNYRVYLEKIVDQKKLPRVTFERNKPTKPFYKDSSILCLVSNYEGWGMASTEAMQYGVVPISFDSYGAVEDIITPERNGMLVTPFDLDEYTDKLRELMKNDEKREEMSLAAFEDVKKFDKKMITNKWIQLFKRIIH